MGSEREEGHDIGRVDDFTEVGRLRDKPLEGDSHLERERFMTEMGYVPQVKNMSYGEL